MVRTEGTENLQDILKQTIIEEDNKLFDAEIGDERNGIASNLVDLYKLKLEEDKLQQDYDLKVKELEAKQNLDKEEMSRKHRELDIRENELEVSKKAQMLDMIKSGVTLAAWAGLSIGVMVFESNGGAILSKAFPGIFPKTRV